MDRREEIIALQNMIINNRAKTKLQQTGEDLWGPAPKLSLGVPPQTEGSGKAPSGNPFFSLEQSTDELMRLVQESADSLEKMTRELERKNQKGTGALPEVPLPETPVLNSQIPKAEQQTQPEKAEETPQPPEKIEDLKAELHGYIGLDTIKAEVDSLINYVTIMQKRKEEGLPTPDLSLHMVFSGNPGTGKTMIARFMSRVYRSLGILSKGHLVETDRSGLVAGYVGQTAIKTKEVIEKAKGGVLFVDEAYALTNRGGENDFGQEAVDTLLKYMEDERDDLIVIVAGYTELMKRFVMSNPGLKSRFNKYIEFPDYSIDELEAIFYMNCSRYDYKVDEEAKPHIRAQIVARKFKQLENFANAREVRNMFEDIITNQARRVAALKNPKPGDLRKITLKDLEDTSAQEAAEKEAARVAKELEKVKGGKKKKSAKKAEEGGSPENGKEADAAEDKPGPEAEKPAEEKAQE